MEGERVVYVQRQVEISAAHRLCSLHLGEEENQRLYGKCYRENGHGHNYTVKVVLRGKVNTKTGMVMNISDLKKAMEVAVVEPLDHRNLDKDVAYFKDKVSTTENLCLFVWENLSKELEDRSLLYEVCIHETDKNTFIYRGE